MSTVYLATDLRLHRDVALKLLYPHLAQDPKIVARFESEAINAAKISHEHIVGVLDQGVDGHHAYLVMEYVRGKTLRDVLKEHGALTPRHTLQLMESVTDGLAAAHEAGLVHRDMKPENVLLTPDGRVKVADFGLARATSNNTASGTLIGTVAYISPELVTGAGADERSDIYAVGIMFYELLTGRQPHTADLPINVAFKHVNDSVPSPSRAVPGLAQDLDELVEWCTAKDPDLRPPNARDLHGEIQHILATLSDDQLDLVPPALIAGKAAAETTENDAEATADATEVLGAGDLDTAVPAGRDSAETEALSRLDHDATQVLGGHQPGQDATAVISDDASQTRAYTRAVPLPGATRDAAPGPATPPAGPGYGVVPVLDEEPEDEASDAPLTEREVRRQAKRDAKAWRKQAQIPTQRLEKSTRGRGLIWGLIVLLLAAILGTAGWFFGAGPGAPVVIPQLQGETRESAVAELAALGVEVRHVDETYHEDIESGRVVSSSPEAEETIRRFQGVTLLVSQGPELFTVPNLRGRTAEEAAAALESSHLAAGDVTEDYNESIAAGEVISQSIQPDEQVRRGTQVDYVLSRGPAPVEVPDVTGEKQDEAMRQLETAGLKGEVAGEDFHASIPAGAVIAQSPAEGTLERGGTVQVTLSKGPRMVEVPNVVGKQLGEARQILEGLGFTVKTSAGSFGIIFNTVATQDPGSGSLPEGSTVTLGVV